MSILWRHTWNDRNSDAEAADVLHKLQEAVHVVEELRDDHFSARLNLH